jgi:hypothetical protein
VHAGVERQGVTDLAQLLVEYVGGAVASELGLDPDGNATVNVVFLTAYPQILDLHPMFFPKIIDYLIEHSKFQNQIDFVLSLLDLDILINYLIPSTSKVIPFIHFVN